MPEEPVISEASPEVIEVSSSDEESFQPELIPARKKIKVSISKSKQAPRKREPATS